ncbi:ABC transporter substrate-binding protein [Rhizomonospora bruguierae]|uniref:ABC transporter substrate-binding protein n=1 Tax=Rhizomonospora bruguierae TaxID=1581705 RepID=UPI001BD19DE8|nr:ABC transporter substrate-binding protein [Micromonospora sp. NBRC 107566]
MPQSVSVRRGLIVVAAGALALSTVTGCLSESQGGDTGSGAGDGSLKNVVFATGSTTGGPHFAIQEIGVNLGFYKEEGLSVSFKHAGGNAQATAELDRDRAQFATGTPSFQVSNYAKNGALPGVNFFEYAYPMKWDFAVKPDSPIQSLRELEGRSVGISALGTADELVAREWLRLAGANPDKVKLTVTGGGEPMGTAVQDSKVDAALTWDTYRGQWDVAGISYRVLPRPEGVSELGGFYLQTKKSTIESDRAMVVGLGRATLKGIVFALANPEAAAAIYLDRHPEAGEGKPREEAVANLVKIMKYRMANQLPADSSLLPGQTRPQEWANEVAFAGAADKVKDPSIFYTNDLVKEINDFDRATIEKMAKEYDWRN